MFALTRRVGQIITIGDDITVTILDIEGADPMVEIQAPNHLPVRREAVYYRPKKLIDLPEPRCHTDRSADPGHPKI